MQAAAHVNSDIGCPVIIHPGRNLDSPPEIVRIYQEAGGKMDKLIMSHLDSKYDIINVDIYFLKLEILNRF